MFVDKVLPLFIDSREQLVCTAIICRQKSQVYGRPGMKNLRLVVQLTFRNVKIKTAQAAMSQAAFSRIVFSRNKFLLSWQVFAILSKGWDSGGEMLKLRKKVIV